jgi:uncharacterized protein YlbG (UPF0298 family)
MSKKDEMQSSLNSLVGGFIAPQPMQEIDKPKEIIKEVNKEIKAPTKDATNSIYGIGNKGNSKYKNGDNLNNNYTITFKIDADIEDYLKNIEKIVFIESVKSGKIESITRTEFVNNLMREQMYKLIGASVKDDADTINKKWLDYKDSNNL